MHNQETKKDTVLLVDDRLDNLRIFQRVLGKQYEVVSANNGSEALTILEDLRPDIILLDIMMPGADGYEVCRSIKSNENTSDIPVIFISVLDEAKDKLKGFEAGGIDFVTKPFNHHEIVARVGAQLTIHKQKKAIAREVEERKTAQEALKRVNEELEKRVEERTSELRDAKEKAEASDRLKSEFLSQITHEIRSPVNAVVNMAEILLQSSTEETLPEHKQALKAIEENGSRLVRTFQLILKMSQIMSGTQPFKPEVFDLQLEVLRTLNAKYGKLAEEKGIEYQYSSSLKQADIYADMEMVMVVFDNLLSNALSYTPEGRISVTVERDDRGRLKVKVADTGIGISEEFIPRLFDPFSQEYKGYARKFEGTGLGLSLIKRYCEYTGADILVESEKGKGAAFTILFPELEDGSTPQLQNDVNE